jgi:hypothetical protein
LFAFLGKNADPRGVLDSIRNDDSGVYRVYDDLVKQFIEAVEQSAALA